MGIAGMLGGILLCQPCQKLETETEIRGAA